MLFRDKHGKLKEITCETFISDTDYYNKIIEIKTANTGKRMVQSASEKDKIVGIMNKRR